jgi:phenylacetic acid degradation operon negative regulatory protein
MVQSGNATPRPATLRPDTARRAARSLTARSVLASALLGEDPPELPVAQLVRLGSLFGLSENRTRVALSRMVAAGEATTDGAARYRLAGHLLERQRRQAASRAGRTGPWSGEWAVVVLDPAPRPAAERTRRRRALAFARLAELREGVWLRPDNLGGPPANVLEAGATMLRSRPDDPVALAARLWPLEAWAARAAELLEELAARPPGGPDDLAPGFELSAAVLRHLQADPLLPAPLLPAGWPGERLRRVYDGWDARYRRVLADWSRRAARP